MKFPEVNRMPLGTVCDFTYECDTLVSFVDGNTNDVSYSRLVTEEKPITLVHEDRDGNVHWYVPNTKYFIDNKHLQPANVKWLEFACVY